MVRPSELSRRWVPDEACGSLQRVSVSLHMQQTGCDFLIKDDASHEGFRNCSFELWNADVGL